MDRWRIHDLHTNGEKTTNIVLPVRFPELREGGLVYLHENKDSKNKKELNQNVTERADSVLRIFSKFVKFTFLARQYLQDRKSIVYCLPI